MDVLVVSSLYDRPGSFTGEHVHRLSRELAEQGAVVQVLCPLSRFDRRGMLRDLPRILARSRHHVFDGIDIHYLPYANIPHAVSPAWESRRLFRCLQRGLRSSGRAPHVIHANRLFPTGAAAISLGRSLQVPVVVAAHGSDVHTNPRRSRRLSDGTKAVIEQADRVTAVSGELARRAEALAKPHLPVATVHLGVDTARFCPNPDGHVLRAELGLPVSGIGFVSVSRLTESKGVFELVEAFRSVARDYPQSWLALVGDGPAVPEIRNRLTDASLADRVILAGAQPNASVPAWLNAADAFVLASHAEGLPNVVLEAMACALPVVATNVGGTSEAIVDGVGFLVPARDSAQLAGAIRKVAASEQLRASLGRNALARIRSHFTWSRVASDYLGIYEAAIAAKDIRQDRPVAS